MKRPIVIAVALVLALGLAACGGNSGAATPASGGGTTEPSSERGTATQTQSGESAATQPSPTPAPDDDAVQLSAAPSNTPEETAPEHTLSLTFDSENLIIVGLIFYHPDILQGFDLSDVTDIKVLVDGAEHDVNATRHEGVNDSDARYLAFDQTFTQYPAYYSVTLKYKGTLYTATTDFNWQSDGTMIWDELYHGDESDDGETTSAFNRTAQAAEATPADGDFLYLMISGLDPNGGYSGDNTHGLYGAEVMFSGNTEDVEYLDISEFTVYMDSEPLPFTVSNITFMSGIYSDYVNETRYNINFYETFSETDAPIPFTNKAVKVWIEAVIGDSIVRSRTLDWQEDGAQQQLDDASISQPLKLEAAAPPLPDFTEEEFYAYHYINDDKIPSNGTPPTVPAPLENHRGDRAYFYVTSDDYIIRSFSAKEPITNVVTTSYAAYSFTDGVCEIVCGKTVYDSVEDSFAVYRMPSLSLRDVPREITHIDNVRYGEVENDTDNHYAIGMTKSEVLKSLERSPGDIYDSMAQ